MMIKTAVAENSPPDPSANSQVSSNKSVAMETTKPSVTSKNPGYIQDV